MGREDAGAVDSDGQPPDHEESVGRVQSIEETPDKEGRQTRRSMWKTGVRTSHTPPPVEFAKSIRAPSVRAARPSYRERAFVNVNAVDSQDATVDGSASSLDVKSEHLDPVVPIGDDKGKPVG